MCGLVGVFDSRGRREVDRSLLRRMNDSLVHRGPDGEGFFVAPGIGLGHRRLAIIDVAGGDQPLFNEDGTVCVVFNGEIYNFNDLVPELEAKGHRFRTRCDTEVIVHGWEEWGPACLDRFRGMFAFALWDANAETLFLARDRLGKKPLYWAELPTGEVLFGSELKALTVHPALDRTLDCEAVEDYFAYGYVPDPKSIYRGVKKLPPAHRLLWRRGERPRVESYWDVRFSEGPDRPVGDAAEELRARLEEAVRIRLISDVPLGAFLSGGVDSSGVVAMMAGLQTEPVKTFCMAFDDPAFDEQAYARTLAERYRTDHHVRTVDPESFDLVDRLAGMYDEPFGDPSAMPTFRVSALARERVTVALSGDGGDEVFAGYRRYLFHTREARMRALLPAGLRRPLFGALGRAWPKLDWAPRVFRAKSTFQELAADEAGGFFLAVSVLNDDLRGALYSPAFKRRLAGYHASDVLRGHMERAGTDHPLLQAQYADLKTWLAGGILVKVDRASMAASLETRAPLLDHELVEWAAGLAPALKRDGQNGKRVLKRAFEPLVPHDLLYRPKRGFSVPLARWFRGPLRARVRAAVTGPAMADTGFFDMDTLARLADDHAAGRRDHAPVLWSLLMFESFLRAGAGAGEAAAAA